MGCSNLLALKKPQKTTITTTTTTTTNISNCVKFRWVEFDVCSTHYNQQ
jgi:hypothetical protein